RHRRRGRTRGRRRTHRRTHRRAKAARAHAPLGERDLGVVEAEARQRDPDEHGREAEQHQRRAQGGAEAAAVENHRVVAAHRPVLRRDRRDGADPARHGRRGTSAPPIAPNTVAPRYPIVLTCWSVRAIAVIATPSETTHTSNAALIAIVPTI